MNSFDFFYQNNPQPFGTEPNKFVKEVPKYLSKGKVLDLGAGDGRNAIYLAQTGYDVTAQDHSQVGLAKLREYASEKKVDIKTVLCDVVDFDWNENYDLIVSILLIHFLKRSDGLKVLQQMKAHTILGGLNVVEVMTTDGEFYDTRENEGNCFMKKDELKSYYTDWEILNYNQVNANVNKKNADGSPMMNVVETMIARKK